MAWGSEGPRWASHKGGLETCLSFGVLCCLAFLTPCALKGKEKTQVGGAVHCLDPAHAVLSPWLVKGRGVAGGHRVPPPLCLSRAVALAGVCALRGGTASGEQRLGGGGCCPRSEPLPQTTAGLCLDAMSTGAWMSGPRSLVKNRQLYSYKYVLSIAVSRKLMIPVFLQFFF